MPADDDRVGRGRGRPKKTQTREHQSKFYLSPENDRRFKLMKAWEAKGGTIQHTDMVEWCVERGWEVHPANPERRTADHPQIADSASHLGLSDAIPSYRHYDFTKQISNAENLKIAVKDFLPWSIANSHDAALMNRIVRGKKTTIAIPTFQWEERSWSADNVTAVDRLFRSIRSHTGYGSGHEKIDLLFTQFVYPYNFPVCDFFILVTESIAYSTSNELFIPNPLMLSFIPTGERDSPYERISRNFGIMASLKARNLWDAWQDGKGLGPPTITSLIEEIKLTLDELDMPR